MTADMNAIIGNRIAALRRSLKLEPAALCGAMGIGRIMLGRIETGRRQITGAQLAAAAKALGVSIEVLTGEATYEAAKGADGPAGGEP